MKYYKSKQKLGLWGKESTYKFFNHQVKKKKKKNTHTHTKQK